ncbi:1-acyl-sn-glycerol-3-phosphate acyltransferase, partial [Erysipelatoclostridium ramosum]|nr:1-acyl-sn-glycerol-3-phosphate acyltransferase [Thomasclavelia ramosa]
MKKWSEKLLSHYRVILDVQFQEQLPKEQPILFVCNHQSEFDMLLQMAV